MTIMIIEGPDLSGKTMAIEQISKHFNSGFVLKNSYKPKGKDDSKRIYAQYWGIINLIIDREDLVILDRFFPSQAVYSYLRGSDEMNHPEIHAFDNYAKELDFLFVYIDTPQEVLEQRYDKRGDEHIKKEQLLELKKRYDEFYYLTDMKKIRVNTMEPDWLDKLEAWMYEPKTEDH